MNVSQSASFVLGVVASALALPTIAFAQYDPTEERSVSAAEYEAALANPVAIEFKYVGDEFGRKLTTVDNMKSNLEEMNEGLKARFEQVGSPAKRKLAQQAVTISQDMLKKVTTVLQRGDAASKGCGTAFRTYIQNVSAEEGSPARAKSKAALNRLPKCTTAMRAWMTDSERALQSVLKSGNRLQELGAQLDAPD